jgi:shikimate kinase
MNIVFIGFASCGKSAAAREISRRLGRRLIDIDQEIEKRYALTRGTRIPYREIIRTKGMPFFFRVEHEALKELAGVTGCVIAPGGGAALREENRAVLRQLGAIIYLKTDPAVIFERMQAKGIPLFMREDPTLENLKRIWYERHAIYRLLADHTIDNTRLSVAETADSVQAYLQRSEHSKQA